MLREDWVPCPPARSAVTRQHAHTRASRPDNTGASSSASTGASQTAIVLYFWHPFFAFEQLQHSFSGPGSSVGSLLLRFYQWKLVFAPRICYVIPFCIVVRAPAITNANIAPGFGVQRQFGHLLLPAAR